MQAEPARALPPLPTSLRLFLYLTIIVTGATILVIEILGARMLTPFFGSSHFVWSAQIAVTMLALAAGYRFGGWIAQRTRGADGLYAAIFVAGLYLVTTVYWRIPLAKTCLKLSLPVGSTMASMGLFFIPLALLATAGPIVVRLMTAALNDVGRQVGRLSAIGTVGSLLGAILVSHVLIPRVRDSIAMLSTAGLLGVLALVYLLGWRRQMEALAAVGIAAVFALVKVPTALQRDQMPVWPNHREIARTNSHFGLMQVLESNDGRFRFYLNDFLIQNTYDVGEQKSVSLFTEMLAGLSEAYTPKLRTALCLGMGVGIVPSRLARAGLQVDVVEINPAVVPLATQFFGFEAGKVRLVIDDARHFLEAGTNRFDTIHLDAFLGDSTPAHLMSQEAFSAIQRRLEPHGTLVINAITSFEPGRDFMGASIHRTLRAVFRNVLVHTARGGNIFFVASDREPLAPIAEIPTAPAHPRIRADVTFAFANKLTVDDHAGIVLTDDYNPSEHRDAPNREEIRKRLTGYAFGN